MLNTIVLRAYLRNIGTEQWDKEQHIIVLPPLLSGRVAED